MVGDADLGASDLKLSWPARGEKVTVFEVGVRDGLQNESRPVTTADKLFLVEGLIRAGVREFELGAFVRPDRVPQMADTAALYESVHAGELDLKRARAYALVPNLKGLERAREAGVKAVAVFTAATDGFNQKNIGMSVRESLAELQEVVRVARSFKMSVRGYVSTAFGCPFEGRVKPSQPLRVMQKLWELGVDEISIGDTIGVATPGTVIPVLQGALQEMPRGRHVAVHFHDTRGTALANSLVALELGIRRFDSSAGGLGGCPFAPGATGNLATEDLVYLLHGLGMKTGLDWEQLCETSVQFAKRIGRPLSSRALQAFVAQRQRHA